MKRLWRLHLHYIHSRCWLDLVEPGPVALGAGFSCLFLQVWCLMLIPPHVPWALSKHAGLVTAPVGPPFLLPAVFFLPPLVAHPPTLQQQPNSPLLLTCQQSCGPERLSGSNPRSLLFLNFLYFYGWNLFDERLCSHCCSAGSVGGSWMGSRNSVLLNGDVGRIGLVIFQAWLVLGG